MTEERENDIKFVITGSKVADWASWLGLVVAGLASLLGLFDSFGLRESLPMFSGLFFLLLFMKVSVLPDENEENAG